MSKASSKLPNDPHQWNASNVISWIKELQEKHRDNQYLSKVKVDRYSSFKGEVLCNLRRDIFLAFEPGFAGELLFEDLQRRKRIASELRFHRGSSGSRPSRRSSEWGKAATMSNKQSQDYPQDKYTSPQPMMRGRDRIYNAHVDPYKEEFLDTDEYVSVILEFGELPDPDYYFTDTNRILRAIFNLTPPTGKNFSTHLEPLLPELLQVPLFGSPMSCAGNEDANTESLRAGRICLVTQVDTVMGSLFHNHLCKGTRQAETILRSAFDLHPQIQELIRDDVEGLVRPPPVLLIPRTAPPEPASTTVFDFQDKKILDLKKKSSDGGYNSSDEGKPSAKGEKDVQKLRLSKVVSDVSIHSERDKTVGWKAEMPSSAIQINAYSVDDTLGLEWNPSLTVPFSVNGMQKGPVEPHDDRYISLEVQNPWPFSIGISLRVFALSRPYNPEIVFPGPYSGLHILEKQGVWKLNAELHYEQSEWCILELLVCQLSPKKHWNIQRHAVVVKKHVKHPLLKRAPHPEPIKKSDNLKAVIGWCVHFVLSNNAAHVSKSFAEAKVILTQLLNLPDFHRPEMRCFVVGCLAVFAKILFETTGARRFISCLLAFHRSSKELLDAARTTQNPRMINLCHLTERLLDTINLEKIIEKQKLPKTVTPPWDLTETRFRSHKKLPVGPLSREQFIDVDSSSNSSTNLYLPSNPVDEGVTIQVCSMSSDEVFKEMKLGDLAGVVCPLACVHITTSPQEVSLKRPFVLNVFMVDDSSQSTSSQYIVMKATDFKGPWSDCTESFDLLQEKEDSGVTKISMKSPLIGWIVALRVGWQPSAIARHALNNLIKEDPIAIKTTVLVSNPSVRNARDRHILVVFAPMNSKQSIIRPPMEVAGRAYKQIGDQQVFQAAVGKRLRVELTGNFVPENASDSLEHEFFAPKLSNDCTVEKWITLESDEPGSSGVELMGKLKVFDIKDGGRKSEVLNIQLDSSF